MATFLLSGFFLIALVALADGRIMHSMYSGLKELPGTRMIIAGRRGFDLSRPENIQLLKGKGVAKVFMIFLGETLEVGYSQAKQDIERRLVEHAGIQFFPMPKEPKNDTRPFEIFSSHIDDLKGNQRALVICYHGLHNSAAYVAYHLLKEGRGFDNISLLFRRSGWSDGSIATIKGILTGAGIDVRRFSEQYVQRALQRHRLAGRHEDLERFRATLKAARESMKSTGKPGHHPKA